MSCPSVVVVKIFLSKKLRTWLHVASGVVRMETVAVGNPQISDHKRHAEGQQQRRGHCQDSPDAARKLHHLSVGLAASSRALFLPLLSSIEPLRHQSQLNRSMQCGVTSIAGAWYPFPCESRRTELPSSAFLSLSRVFLCAFESFATN